MLDTEAEILTENGQEMVGTDIVTVKIDIEMTAADTMVMAVIVTVTVVRGTEMMVTVTVRPVIDPETVSSWNMKLTGQESALIEIMIGVMTVDHIGNSRRIKAEVC